MGGADNHVKLAGWVGLAGALIVGVAEFLLQFNPAGGYADGDYSFFKSISADRLTAGYYLGVLAAPLYIVGYWFLERLLEPAGKKRAAVFFLVGAYAFAVGAVWLGERAFLAFTVQGVGDSEEGRALLQLMAAHNEPLVNVLRAAMAIVSVLWIVLILSGRSALPRWMALFSPFAILAAIFVVYFVAPAIGVYILPVAMNLTHIIVFGLALLSCRAVARA